MKALLLAGLMAVAASGSANAAVQITNIAPGTSPYSGPTPTFDFDTTTPVFVGGHVVSGTTQVNAAPFGSTGNYYSVSPTDGPGTIALASVGPISSLSFLWGSADFGNTVDFYNTAGALIGSFTGGGIWGLAANGDRSSGSTNSVVTFGFSGADQSVGSMALTAKPGGNNSTGISFEIDNIAISPVPEMGSWALMTLGLGLLGTGLRRRAKRVRAAFA